MRAITPKVVQFAERVVDIHANADAVTAPHSCLTEHLIDRPGEPTRDAPQVVLEHFRSRLVPAA